MHLSTFVIGVLIFTLYLSQIESTFINENEVQQLKNEEGERNSGVNGRRQSREDEEEEEDGERKQPALYPLLFNLFGTVVGANQTLVNKTVDKIVDRYNGIDPDAPKTKLPVPVVTTLKSNKGEAEEEDEDEETRRRRRYW